jgi:hypothetical protein
LHSQEQEERRPVSPASSHQDAQVMKQSHPLFIKIHNSLQEIKSHNNKLFLNLEHFTILQATI